MLMEQNGLRPANGPVAVTGATGGVGSVAVEILAKSGYHVVAITGKPEERAYLTSLGAKEVLDRRGHRPHKDPARSTRRPGRVRSTTSVAISSHGCCRR